MKGLFPLGFGTNHFPVLGEDDREGFEKSVAIAYRAIELGVDYFDAAPTYSRGFALKVIKEALSQTKREVFVTAKYKYNDSLSVSQNADYARASVESSLKTGGSAVFMAWAIKSYAEFEKIISKGGVYEEALRLKNDGVVSGVTCSCHAPLGEMVKIIKSGAFSAVTVSFSLLNAVAVRPALEAAAIAGGGGGGVDIITMNSSGAGIIPNNKAFFNFARVGEESVTAAALRFVKAHEAVKVVLTAPSTIEQLQENVLALTAPGVETSAARLARVYSSLSEIKGFCTGCGYCAPCPKGIPVSQIANVRNCLLMGATPVLNRTDVETIENINILSLLERDTGFLPETPENPCENCGVCEKRCTQNLKIIGAVDDTFNRAAKAGFSKLARKERLNALLNGKGYTRVGVYPSGGYADKVMETYREFFGEPPFEFILFNSQAAPGETRNGLTVHLPGEIETLTPDCILVANYKFQAEIYEAVKGYEAIGVKILKLHQENDAPWLY